MKKLVPSSRQRKNLVLNAWWTRKAMRVTNDPIKLGVLAGYWAMLREALKMYPRRRK